MDKRVQVGVAVIVIKDKKVLLGKRKGAHGVGTWGFPGGKLEYGEEINTCVKRETLEETAITVKHIRFGTMTNDIFTSDEKHFVTIFMICDYKSGRVKVMELEKCEEWEWFDWNTLPKPLFLPIQNLLKKRFNPIRQI